MYISIIIIIFYYTDVANGYCSFTRYIIYTTIIAYDYVTILCVDNIYN